MVKVKTISTGKESIGVKAKYKGTLGELTIDMIAILADFGTTIADNEASKEDIEEIFETIKEYALKHIDYK